MHIPSQRQSLEEQWHTIEEFPLYSVSHHGRIRNDTTGRLLTIFVNNRGLAYTGLRSNGRQSQRGIAQLVACAFLPPPRFPAFDSVINKDGDRLNNHVDNLAWRPMWFSAKYHRQFLETDGGAYRPIEEVATGERFYNELEAAARYGLLRLDIVRALASNAEVWPTRLRFRKL